MRVVIAITVYRNPERLGRLFDNMRWAGWPDVRTLVIEDPSPFEDRAEMTVRYTNICAANGVPLYTCPAWGCMHGAIQAAFEQTTEDWVIYVPDDVIFTKGGLWNEYASVLAYGRDFVGGIQAPYWNATDLVSMGCMPGREAMFSGWKPEGVPQNPHWNGFGVPRTYINLNGAGFSMSRRLFEAMGSRWPRETWRLDEWAGYQAWMQGMVCITVPGPARIHYFGGTTPLQPNGMQYHTAESWALATGGYTPAQTGNRTRLVMEQLPTEEWDDVLRWFAAGNRLHPPA